MIVQEIFQLIVTNFKGLDDVNSPSFSRRVNILETVAKVRSCVVMLDLECDDLILEMFETFFDTARCVSMTERDQIFVTHACRCFAGLAPRSHLFRLPYGMAWYGFAVPRGWRSLRVVNDTIHCVGIGSDEQPHNVFVAMRNVLTLVLEESEKIPAAMVEVILKNLLKQKKVGLTEVRGVGGVCWG